MVSTPKCYALPITYLGVIMLLTSQQLYGHLPRIPIVVKRRRLALAAHISRHNEPAGKMLLWSLEVKR